MQPMSSQRICGVVGDVYQACIRIPIFNALHAGGKIAIAITPVQFASLGTQCNGRCSSLNARIKRKVSPFLFVGGGGDSVNVVPLAAGENRQPRMSSAQRALGNMFTVSPTNVCLLYTSPSPRDGLLSRMPSSA